MAEDSLRDGGCRTSMNSVREEGERTLDADADDGRMQQRWNPRMRGADGGEDGGGEQMRWRGANSGTLEYGKLGVNGLGECGKAKKFGRKGWAKENLLLQTRVAKTCL